METVDEVLKTEKVPPQNVDAEVAVLGAMLIEEDAIAQGIETLQPEAFYKEAHQKIFQAIQGLFNENKAVDLVTLTEALDRSGSLEAVGGPSYLAFLTTSVPTAANIQYHVRIVREKYILRHLITSATQIVRDSYDSGQDVEGLLDRAERLIFEITSKKFTSGVVPLKEIIRAQIETIDRLYQRREHVTGIATGYHEFDTMTAGLQPSDLIIIAARPSMGKSALACCIAEHAGLVLKVPTAMFSLEMSKEQLIQRMLCSTARINAHKVRTGFFAESDWKVLTGAASKLSNAPIYIDDTPGISALELKAKARRLKAQFGIKLLILDYLQLMRGVAGTENRQQEISEISRSLKELARELNIPVIAVSQLSRAVESRTDHRPQLSDLRECVTGDTLVTLADGRRVPIARLEGQTPEVLAVTPQGRLVVAQSDKVWRVGIRPVITIRLASGRSITVTHKHRLFGAEGWIRAGALRAGDRLAIARTLPEAASPEKWPDLRLALLGQLIGDGSYLSNQPLRYTTASEDNSSIVATAAREEFCCKVKRYKGRGNWHQLLISGNGNRWHPAGVGRWLKELGIFGQRSHEKRIPETVFRLSNGQIALLLRHLWATDGTISPRRRDGRGSHAVNFSTNSSGLAQDVAALLLRLGIVARICKIAQGRYRPVYYVAVSGTEAQKRFLEHVETFGPRVVQARMLAPLLEGVVSNTNVDTLPIAYFSRVKTLMRSQGISQRRMAALRGTSYGGSSHFKFAPSRSVLTDYAAILNDRVLQNHADNDLFWDRVISVEPAGEAEVFDLTVPGPSSWLADSIVSHNSGAIEQDSDVVVLLLREEYYNPTPENQGKAEIIVAKQRNGPVGTFKLAFIHEYTRFENAELIRREEMPS